MAEGHPLNSLPRSAPCRPSEDYTSKSPMTGEEWLDSAALISLENCRPPEASEPPTDIDGIPGFDRTFTAKETE